MKVYLDGNLIDAAGTTLERAIDSARTHAGTRMLVEALADGRPVPAADFDHPPAKAPYANELAFRSADAARLLADLSDDLSSALQQASDRQDAAANLIRMGQVEAGVSGIGEILELWKMVKEGIEVTLQTSSDQESRSRELSGTLAALAVSLNEIRRTMSEQDWAGLSDCLAYDMQEHARRCREWIARDGRVQSKQPEGKERR